MAKIIAINGSPKPEGNTAGLLKTVLDICKSAGHEVELYHAGGRTVQGCTACGGCKAGACVIGDWINELHKKMVAADAIIMGSPTYFATLTPELKAVIDRTGFTSRRNGNQFSRKIGAAVSAVRRCGSIHVLDSINHFFQISDMVVPGSSYWNMGVAAFPGDFEKDDEGVKTMQRLGENVNWLLEKLAD